MLSDKKTAYLLLGSNLGDREKFITDALALLEARVGELAQVSGQYETAAWGKTDQPSFINMAIKVETVLDPFQLLEAVLKIEADLGRVRYEKWGSRLIDIDIILYEDQVIDQEQRLQIPHPEMQHRKFVLLPLSEIASNIVHPILKKNISELLYALEDDLSVTKK